MNSRAPNPRPPGDSPGNVFNRSNYSVASSTGSNHGTVSPDSTSNSIVTVSDASSPSYMTVDFDPIRDEAINSTGEFHWSPSPKLRNTAKKYKHRWGNVLPEVPNINTSALNRIFEGFSQVSPAEEDFSIEIGRGAKLRPKSPTTLYESYHKQARAEKRPTSPILDMAKNTKNTSKVHGEKIVYSGTGSPINRNLTPKEGYFRDGLYKTALQNTQKHNIQSGQTQQNGARQENITSNPNQKNNSQEKENLPPTITRTFNGSPYISNASRTSSGEQRTLTELHAQVADDSQCSSPEETRPATIAGSNKASRFDNEHSQTLPKNKSFAEQQSPHENDPFKPISKPVASNPKFQRPLPTHEQFNSNLMSQHTSAVETPTLPRRASKQQSGELSFKLSNEAIGQKVKSDTKSRDHDQEKASELRHIQHPNDFTTTIQHTQQSFVVPQTVDLLASTKAEQTGSLNSTRAGRFQPRRNKSTISRPHDTINGLEILDDEEDIYETLDVYKARVAELEKEKSASDDSHKEMQIKISALEDAKAQADALNMQLQEQLTSIQSNMSQLEKQRLSLAERNEKLESDATRFDELFNSMEQRILEAEKSRDASASLHGKAIKALQQKVRTADEQKLEAANYFQGVIGQLEQQLAVASEKNIGLEQQLIAQTTRNNPTSNSQHSGSHFVSATQNTESAPPVTDMDEDQFTGTTSSTIRRILEGEDFTDNVAVKNDTPFAHSRRHSDPSFGQPRTVEEHLASNQEQLIRDQFDLGEPSNPIVANTEDHTMTSVGSDRRRYSDPSGQRRSNERAASGTNGRESTASNQIHLATDGKHTFASKAGATGMQEHAQGRNNVRFADTNGDRISITEQTRASSNNMTSNFHHTDNGRQSASTYGDQKRRRDMADDMTSAFLLPDIAPEVHHEAEHPSLSHDARYVLNGLCKHKCFNCTVCARVTTFNGKDGGKHTVQIPTPIPVSERMPEPEPYEDEPTLRPSVEPSFALATVIKELTDEIDHLKMSHCRAVTAYTRHDGSLGMRQRKGLKAKMDRLSDEIEVKSDQLYALHDALEGMKH